MTGYSSKTKTKYKKTPTTKKQYYMRQDQFSFPQLRGQEEVSVCALYTYTVSLT